MSTPLFITYLALFFVWNALVILATVLIFKKSTEDLTISSKIARIITLSLTGSVWLLAQAFYGTGDPISNVPCKMFVWSAFFGKTDIIG